MAQLRWGARQTLDAINADLNDIIDLATDDPHTVRRLAERIIRRIREEIEPKLQREAPALEQRIAALEEQMKELLNSRLV
jgi:hypothetical protein